MIHKKTRPEPLGKPFSGKKPAPERSRSTICLSLISSTDHKIRTASIEELAAICSEAIAESNDTSLSLLRFFEYHAKYSPHEDVRKGCIDALAECRDTFRLKSLNFEIGADRTKRYRDEVLQRLEQEIS